MTGEAKIILFVHQSAELYGSDRVLLSIVQGLDRRRWQPIVVLPESGPLLARLQRLDVECHVAEVGKAQRADLSAGRLLAFPLRLYRCVRAIDRLVAGRQVQLVHTNTLAVLGGAAWAWSRGVTHLWHVHEVVPGPALARAGYPRLVRALSDRVVCNSHYTKDWLVSSQAGLRDLTTVIWNGYDPRPSPPGGGAAVRSELGVADGTVLLGLVGRINATKGHGVLLDACELLASSGVDNFRLLFVGSVYGSNTHFLADLQARIQRSPIAGQVLVRGFQEDLEAIWQAIDVAVVPSIGSEAFGLVALEAMAAGKPVVASDLGGLSEVVEAGVTGCLVPPSDPRALADALRRLILDASTRARMGALGRQRQERLFSLRVQQAAFAALYDVLCRSGHGGQVATV